MSHRIALPRLVAACLVALGVSGAAQAALIDRGGGLIYDTDLNVTWLQNANAALGSSYDTADYYADGRMTWQNAVDWAANFSYYDSIRNITYDDWRLPTWTGTGAPGLQCSYGGTDCGYNVDPASSEMAHLFFTELGNISSVNTSGVFVGGSSDVNWGLVNKGPFTNFQSRTYWFGTELNDWQVWVFDTHIGNQDFSYKEGWVVFQDDDSFYALAVRPGDVAAVPEAETYALMLAGLGLVGWRARRRG